MKLKVEKRNAIKAWKEGNAEIWKYQRSRKNNWYKSKLYFSVCER